MIIHNVEQGTPEWLRLRMGVPTASRFGEVYTATGKPSASSENYMYSLLAEIRANEPAESFTSEAMERGTMLEPEAVTAYEMMKDRSMDLIGFVTNDTGTIGCSPDRMGLEVKCPALKTHLKYLIDGKCPTKYVPQVQGCIWLCEQNQWDFMSYYPGERPLIVTVKRDDNYIAGLSKHLNEFIDKLTNAKSKLESGKW